MKSILITNAMSLLGGAKNIFYKGKFMKLILILTLVFILLTSNCLVTPNPNSCKNLEENKLKQCSIFLIIFQNKTLKELTIFESAVFYDLCSAKPRCI